MSTEIAPLQAVQNKIRDKIRAEFVELMPEDMWTKMVQSVIEEFTFDKPDSYGKKTPSPLRKLIQDEVQAVAKDAVAKQLAKLDANAWNQFGEKTANDAVIKLVTEHFNEIVTSMQKSFGEMMVMNAVTAFRNGRY